MPGVAAGMALTRRIGPARVSPAGQRPPRARCRTRSGRGWRGAGAARPLGAVRAQPGLSDIVAPLGPPLPVSDAVRRPPFPLRFSPTGIPLVCSQACWRFALNWPHPCCLVVRPQMRPSRPRHARPAPSAGRGPAGDGAERARRCRFRKLSRRGGHCCLFCPPLASLDSFGSLSPSAECPTGAPLPSLPCAASWLRPHRLAQRPGSGSLGACVAKWPWPVPWAGTCAPVAPPRAGCRLLGPP